MQASRVGCMDGTGGIISGRDMFKAINEISQGTACNHVKPKPMNLIMPNGKKTTTDKERMDIMRPHCEKLYNPAQPRLVSPDALEFIVRRERFQELDDPYTWEEFTKAVNGLETRSHQGRTGSQRNISRR